jgi:hypothetical protein
MTRDNRVPVGRCARRAERSKGAAGSANVLHYKLLAKVTGENVCHDPASDVGRSTGRKWHNYRDGSRRVVMGLRATHLRERQKCRRNPLRLHRSLPYVKNTVDVCTAVCASATLSESNWQTCGLMPRSHLPSLSSSTRKNT